MGHLKALDFILRVKRIHRRDVSKGLMFLKDPSGCCVVCRLYGVKSESREASVDAFYKSRRKKKER